MQHTLLQIFLGALYNLNFSDPETFIVEKYSQSDTFIYVLFNEFCNQAGTSKAIISMPPHSFFPIFFFTLSDSEKMYAIKV
jgi:hypothetical protein